VPWVYAVVLLESFPSLLGRIAMVKREDKGKFLQSMLGIAIGAGCG